MTPEELAELTLLIDTYNYDNQDVITPNDIYATWWPLLNKLRQAENKAALIEDWKYKKELEITEYIQENCLTDYITIEDSEKRFVFDLWLGCYH